MSKELYIQEVSKYLADLQTRIDDSDKRQVAELLNAIPLYGEEMFNKGIKEGRTEEREAWLDGRRCHTCGREKELNLLTDTCPKCFENE